MINVLNRSLNISSVVVERGTRKSAQARASQLRRRYSFLQFAERLVLRSLRLLTCDARRRDRSLRRVLGSSSDAFADDLPIVEVPGVNGQAARQHLEAIRPDLILVYGTGIVRDQVLAIATIGALNMHTGLSPEYRGSDCSFWPVHDRRFDLLGATVHECTSRIDGGAILGRRRAQPQEGDGLHEVFARCVRAGADLYAECASVVVRTGSIIGREQDMSLGTEYRASMRGLRAEVRARVRLRQAHRHHAHRRPV